MSNKYAKENIVYGKNKSIPEELSPENIISDDFLSSYGIYSKDLLEKARFTRFSKFGRLADPYGHVNPAREYLFFVKPDLHICVPNNNLNTDLYKIGNFNTQETYGKNGLLLNPQLLNNPYFRHLIESNPNVIRELQYSVSDSIGAFSHLLSFYNTSTLSLESSEAETVENSTTIFGAKYSYLLDSEKSDNGNSFSLEFNDNKYLDVYHFFKAYSEYHIARKTGFVTPPSLDYYKYRRLHNTMGVYKFVVAEDMETILYWAYLWGVYPTNCPRDAFNDVSFSDGLSFTINFQYAFIEDMNPMILYQFNELMKPTFDLFGCDKNKWIPTVRQNISENIGVIDNISPNSISYDPTLEGSGIDRIDGTLPVAALVDGRNINGEDRPRYRLRWYAPSLKFNTY